MAVVYFRAGYTPTDYAGEAEWAARVLVERCDAYKCPTVAYQLAGAKKIQQAGSVGGWWQGRAGGLSAHVAEPGAAPVRPLTPLPSLHLASAPQDLARPGVVERYAPAADAELLRTFFAGQWGLEDLSDPATAAVVAHAIAQPEQYVLKPQREGGGNNYYGEALAARLAQGGRGLAAFILMQRILPPSHRAVMVRRGQAVEADTLSELGVYSTYVRRGDTVLLSAEAGHLVRTKAASSDEGGVAAGFAVLDSPLLV